MNAEASVPMGWPLWIRRGCRVLIALQTAGIAMCLYGIVQGFVDDTPSEFMTAASLIPWFVMVLGVIAVLLLLTFALLKNSGRRHAWSGLMLLAFITTLPFTSQVMNWIRG